MTKTKKQKKERSRRRTDRWNGPLGNSKRKIKEQCSRAAYIEAKERIKRQEMEELKLARFMEAQDKTRKRQTMDNTFSERMNGFWYGSVNTFGYEVGSVNRSPRPDEMVRRTNRILLSATPSLGRIQDVFEVQKTLASLHLLVKSIWNKGSNSAFFRGNEINVHKVTPKNAIMSTPLQ